MTDVEEIKAQATRVNTALLARGLTVATAESLTGGGLADAISAVPGASSCFPGGVVSYATEAKQDLLGVEEETVAEHGVVSEQCAAQMARGVRRLLGTDVGVATTGVAGPTEQEGKPVGLVYVAVAWPEGLVTHKLQLDGERPQIRDGAVHAALSAVLAALQGPDV